MGVVIYGLRCPLTGSIRYIGKTINPKTRLAAHICKAKTHQTTHHCSDWIRSLLNAGLKPSLEVLFEVPGGEAWQLHEKRLIAEHRQQGDDLTNLTGGGEGFYAPNPELLARRGQSLRELWARPEMKARRRQATKETSNRPEIRAQRAASISSAWANPETKTRMLEGMRTPEARARRAEATRRRNADPEFAAKHAAKMKALFSDPERKEQLRLASEKRWREYRARKTQ